MISLFWICKANFGSNQLEFKALLKAVIDTVRVQPKMLFTFLVALIKFKKGSMMFMSLCLRLKLGREELL